MTNPDRYLTPAEPIDWPEPDPDHLADLYRERLED